MWSPVWQLLRPATAASAGSIVRGPTCLLGSGHSEGGLSELWRCEARGVGLAGGQSVLHETLRVLRGEAMSSRDDQGRGAGTALGLAHGQGTGETVHARTTEARWPTRTEGDWDRRNIHPQRAQLSHRGE